MSQPARQSLRVVIQHVVDRGCDPSYRIVAYGDRCNYRPAQFDTLEQLLNVLKTAFPRLDFSTLSNREHSTETSIIFADVIELDAEQLSRLGLKQ